MNSKRLLLAGVMLAAAMPLAPAAQAGSCDAQSSGVGYEEASCTFQCIQDEYLTVVAQTGGGGSVWGKATCGDKFAECRDDDGGCAGSSGYLSYGGAGTCEGNGNDGSFSWTTFYVKCESKSCCSFASSALADSSPLHVSPHPPALEELPPLVGSTAWIIGQDGDVTGFVCTPYGCAEVPVECGAAETEGAWTCRA